MGVVRTVLAFVWGDRIGDVTLELPRKRRHLLVEPWTYRQSRMDGSRTNISNWIWSGSLNVSTDP